GVDQLEAACGGHDVVHLAAHRFGARDHEDRTEALAAREDAVPHRLVDHRGSGGRPRPQTIEGLLGPPPAPAAARPPVATPPPPPPPGDRLGSRPSFILPQDLDRALGILEPARAEAEEPRPLREDAERVVQ